MQATVEYEPVVTKLLEKSRQGRVNWERRGVKNGWRQFECTIEGQYTFSLARTDDEGYELAMRDSERDIIFSVKSGSAIVYRDAKEAELASTLRDLYELVRKRALNVDEKIATATGLLDRI